MTIAVLSYRAPEPAVLTRNMFSIRGKYSEDCLSGPAFIKGRAGLKRKRLRACLGSYCLIFLYLMHIVFTLRGDGR